MKRLQVIIADAARYPEAESAAQVLSSEGGVVNLHVIGESDTFAGRWPAVDDPAFLAELSKLPMGTHFYTYLDRETANLWMDVAERLGLHPEEMTVHSASGQQLPVFCAGCYGLNPPTQAATIRCVHCGRTLHVSSHASRRLRAVMGYLSVQTDKIGIEVQP